MRKIGLISLILCIFLISGCGKFGEKELIKELSNKIEKSKGYFVESELEIINNEDRYNYEVKSSYSKKDNYKVSLLNKNNEHEQIILKNKEGVYVLTPSLNKSFKFQSKWPNNTSQIYLLQPILEDLKKDNNRKYKETNDHYILESKVNYPNNKNFEKQIVYIDKKLNIKEVHIIDKDRNVQMKLKIKNINYNKDYDNKDFALDENMKASISYNNTKKVSAIKDTIYPMYIPDKTYLKKQETIKKENGDRIILTFEGEKPFTLIEETLSPSEEMLVIPIYGEIEMTAISVAAVSDKSLTWNQDNMEYYIISEKLSKNEMVEVAKSIAVMPVGK